MADSIVGGLFGMTPQAYQAQQNQQALAQSAELGQLDPFALARTGLIYGGRQIGNAIAGALGGGDPQLQLLSQRNAVMKGLDLTDPGSLQMAAQKLSDVGDTQGALGLAQQAAVLKQQQMEANLTGAKYQKEVFSAGQEAKLRDELSKLGPDATQEQVLSVVTKYGSPDRVLAALQASADRAAQRDSALQLARERIDANIQAAKDRNANAKEIAQMQIEGRKEIALLAASLKGPSSAELKAQERADKIAEGKESLADSVSVAKTLVNDLAKSGGMTSTSQGPLANLITSLGTGTVGQFGGRLVGTANQAKRDELNSVRLQLFNSVKEATGMSASQLNSNVELKTWLNSLGGPDMTKEANEAILNNISNKYLKGMPTTPAGGDNSDPLGIRKK